MTVFQAFFQGVIQGLTEFLPVSSSGHLSVAAHFFGIEGAGTAFSVFLHLGTLAAVVLAFFPRVKELFFEFFRMIADIFRGRFSFKNCGQTRRMLLMMILSLAPLLCVYPIKDTISALGEDEDVVVEGICFIYTAILLLLASYTAKRTAEPLAEVTPGRAVYIGFMQAIALLPGVSRSGSTVGAGLISGVDRGYMVDYSFILSIPVIFAAGVSETKDAFAEGLGVGVFPLIVGVVTAAAVGFFAIKALSWMVKNDKLWIFSIYLFLLGGFTVVAGMSGL
ncbi:MAG: undecaprenyl-diphosphate phosphatase [Clostridia bacterium]|nr:undecaprenyl-diphosphate phosphatase [Clostridia bacterium]